MDWFVKRGSTGSNVRNVPAYLIFAALTTTRGLQCDETSHIRATLGTCAAPEYIIGYLWMWFVVKTEQFI